VFYLTYNDTSKTTVCMKADLSGAGKEKIPFQGTVYEIVPDSEGKWLYASVSSKTAGSADILRMEISGGESQPVIAWKDGSEEGISFSHDQKHLLFTSNRDGLWQIYIADRDGNTPIRISDAPANHALPRYSPGDEYISFVSDRGNFRESKDLWLLEATNGKMTRITQNAKIQDYLWLDKNVILYAGGENLFDLNTINIFTGENRKFIISKDRKAYSEINPSLLLYKKDTYILYTREYLDGAKKLFMVKRDGSQDMQATFDNGNSWIE
jgi:Tol biopolymer transport system component